jgi:hypothetical protein
VHEPPYPQDIAASRSVKSAESWGIPNVRPIRHEAVVGCGSYEIHVDGLRSGFFYWGNVAGRRLRSKRMTGAQTLELAKLLARGLSMIR